MTAALARTAEDLSTLDDRAIVRYVLLQLALRRLTPHAEVSGLYRAQAHARALLEALEVQPMAAPEKLANVVDMAAYRSRRAS